MTRHNLIENFADFLLTILVGSVALVAIVGALLGYLVVATAPIWVPIVVILAFVKWLW